MAKAGISSYRRPWLVDKGEQEDIESERWDHFVKFSRTFSFDSLCRYFALHAYPYSQPDDRLAAPPDRSRASQHTSTETDDSASQADDPHEPSPPSQSAESVTKKHKRQRFDDEDTVPHTWPRGKRRKTSVSSHRDETPMTPTSEDSAEVWHNLVPPHASEHSPPSSPSRSSSSIAQTTPHTPCADPTLRSPAVLANPGREDTSKQPRRAELLNAPDTRDAASIHKGQAPRSVFAGASPACADTSDTPSAVRTGETKDGSGRPEHTPLPITEKLLAQVHSRWGPGPCAHVSLARHQENPGSRMVLETWLGWY